MDIDTLGHIIIANLFGHSVHVIDKDKAFVCQLLTEEAGIKEPHGLCIQSVWVTELESRLVKKFTILEK